LKSAGVELSEGVEAMHQHDREVIDKVNLNAPFLKGDSAAVRFEEMSQLAPVVNPAFNGGDARLIALGKALKRKRCGEYPRQLLESWRDSAFQVIGAFESICRCREVNIARTAVQDFFNYLATPNGETDKEHCRKIDEFIEKLKSCFCDVSNAGYDCYTAELERRGRCGETQSAFRFGDYARQIVDVCNREGGLIGIRGEGLFYVKNSSSTAWSVLKDLIETNDPKGFAQLSKYVNWRSAFTSTNRAQVPADLRKQGVRSAKELSRLIVAEGKTGRFRLVAGRFS